MEEKGMYEVFGEFDSAQEINMAAEGLKKEGDADGLYKLAEENGIDKAFAEIYLADGILELCDVATAAVGKIDIESVELKPTEIIRDWVEYIKAECMANDELALAVRKKGKSLKGCIAELLKWSFKARYKIDKEIVKAAGIGNANVEMGIPGMGTAKKLIKEYYQR